MGSGGAEGDGRNSQVCRRFKRLVTRHGGVVGVDAGLAET